MTFIDVEKDYVRVPREETWTWAMLKNVADKYITRVQDMYHMWERARTSK